MDNLLDTDLMIFEFESMSKERDSFFEVVQKIKQNKKISDIDFEILRILTAALKIDTFCSNNWKGIIDEVLYHLRCYVPNIKSMNDFFIFLSNFKNFLTLMKESCQEMFVDAENFLYLFFLKLLMDVDNEDQESPTFELLNKKIRLVLDFWMLAKFDVELILTDLVIKLNLELLQTNERPKHLKETMKKLKKYRLDTLKNIPSIEKIIIPQKKSILNSFKPRSIDEIKTIASILENPLKIHQIKIESAPIFSKSFQTPDENGSSSIKIEIFSGHFLFETQKIECIFKKYSSLSPIVFQYSEKEEEVYSSIHKSGFTDWAVIRYLFQEISNENGYESVFLLEKCECNLFQCKNIILSEFNETELKFAVRNLIEGFLVLKQKGICHNDIKPSNVLVKNKIFKITDFNCSLIYSQNAFTRFILDDSQNDFEGGTYNYLAPEIVFSKQFPKFQLKIKKFRADVFSLGLTLLEICNSEIEFSEYVNGLLEYEEKNYLMNYFNNSANLTKSVHKKIKQQLEEIESIFLSKIRKLQIYEWIKKILYGALRLDFRNRLKFSEVYEIIINS